MVESKVTYNSILEASKRLEGKIVRTPILQSKYINEKLESNIFLKAENLQTIGAFKFRGAMNSILQLLLLISYPSKLLLDRLLCLKSLTLPKSLFD